MPTSRTLLVRGLMSLVLLWHIATLGWAEIPTTQPAVRCSAAGSLDQDDMCFWLDREDPSRSTVITSDKEAGKLFVYDLAGNVLQTIDTPKPGNIDARSSFPLGGETVDIVVHNQRADGFRLVMYRVDPKSRQLTRIDNGQLTTGDNYGGTLFRSPKTGRFYFITTSETGTCEQYELSDDGRGRVQGRKVRSWTIGKCEGAVADDQTGTVYISEETKGVWAVGAEPDDPTPGRLVVRVGTGGVRGDLEGLALTAGNDADRRLIVSDQGAGCFRLYRLSDFAPAGVFAIEGAGETDGIELLATNLGPMFPAGIFACHTDQGRRPVLLTGWDQVARSLIAE